MAILRWLLIAHRVDSGDGRVRPASPAGCSRWRCCSALTLAFPDQAPSRFKIAMRIGTTLQLRKIVADARAGRIGDTPAEAAEKLLELVAALSVHDRLTRGHSERVRAYTHMVGEELKISGAALDHLRWSALLHDIGKLLVSAEILNKPGKLTDTEFEAIKQHPDFGRELVATARRLARRLGTGGVGAPRTLGRPGLPAGPVGHRHQPGRTDRGGHRRVRRDDIGPVVQGSDLACCRPRRAGALRREPFRRNDRQGVLERVAGPVADGDGTVVVADAAFLRPADARHALGRQEPRPSPPSSA